MRLAPFRLILLPQRIMLFLVYAGMNYYVYHYFISPSSYIFKELSLITAIIWSIISFMFLWSYIIVCWIDAGSTISLIKNIKPHEKEKYEFLTSEKLNKCEKCNLPKTERTHHCSKCNLCYYKFDHHCLIIGNCIGFHNSQAFVIFLVYGTLSWLFAGIITFFSKSYYNGFNSTDSFVITLGFACLFICNFIFAKLSYEDYTQNRTAYDRVTHRKYSVKRLKLKYPFPIYKILPDLDERI
ncbi:DHHC zinc finger domain containing protein [Trichomonas vaginalis G3]|uniref:Palmitoyltransferase n=1 Tax=Trichomonas vaginalis (strain ATCC PRA-98 / G3) TaxID=412133 RepID=A2EML2_TRIV3|nr:cysteine S-palmitoyltransferase protein [Trichomonas vaginalis G3]EAY06082.1 DHHC zinc finger domain containing protein [Trichomonas vaginalis G3]KAI5497121.1 cysteine S-palmitoyltransferase protein [Trichomonas vaginalis G3]|eukprot:XP_001318305.1 DHHC zinc finger domain containing protein [Trichomonas vaginalis G3]